MRALSAGCIALLGLITGCDQVFGLSRPDAAIDAAAPADVIDAIDAAPVLDASLESIGCADGTREALVDPRTYPNIAACGGAWTLGGVRPAQLPTCARTAGNSSVNALGTGCTASDLCADGWDVCATSLDVRGAIAPATSCAELSFPQDQLYITRQSGPSGARCDATGTNDVAGCGTIGNVADAATCGALTRFTPNDCFDIRPLGWRCTEPGEAGNIYKIDPDIGGGVLCCRVAL